MSSVAVITFPGSNDDGDAAYALELLGASVSRVWHAADRLPPDTGGVLLPGGFSYGDYLRCGAIARFAPVMSAVAAFAQNGGPVLGVCNGFQILCEAGLLPGVLRGNRQQEFICADVDVRVVSSRTVFTDGCAVGDRLTIPVKHGEGSWYADDPLFASVLENDQIVFEYTEDVNGARGRVAGVSNREGNVVGLMPHPEHAVDPLLGPTGGVPVLMGLALAAGAARQSLTAG